MPDSLMMVWLGFPGIPSQITTVFLSSSSTCFDSVPAEGVSVSDPPCPLRQRGLYVIFDGKRFPSFGRRVLTAILPGCHQFGDSSSLIVYPVNFDRVPRANPNTLIFERVRRTGFSELFR